MFRAKNHLETEMSVTSHLVAWNHIQSFTADKPLHRAIIKGDLAETRKYLDKEPNSVNSTTLLGYASYTTFQLALICHEDEKAAEFIKLFLQYKPQLNATDTNGQPELWHAIVALRTTCVELLLNAGSDPNFKIQRGMSTLIKGETKEIHFPVVTSALREFGSKVKLTDNLVKICNLLLAHSLDPTYIPPYYCSLLHIILQLDLCTADFLSLFLNAKQKIDVNSKTLDEEENSLLHYSVLLNKPGCLKLLLERKANPNILNQVGMTPLDICQIHYPSSTDMIQTLLKYGAEPSPMPDIFSKFTKHMPFVVENGCIKLPKQDELILAHHENKENKEENEFEKLKNLVDECYSKREVADLPLLSKKKYKQIKNLSDNNQLKDDDGHICKAMVSHQKQSCVYTELNKESVVKISQLTQITKPFVLKKKLSWDLLQYFSSAKHLKLLKKRELEVAGQRLTVLDATSLHHKFIVHTTKTHPDILSRVLKSRADFFNQEPYISCSIIDKITPPAEMSHQDNLMFPVQLLLQVPVHRLQYAAHTDLGSGIGIFSNAIRFLDSRMKVSLKLNWLETQYQQKSFSHYPNLNMPLPPYLVQAEYHADPRYRQCFSEGNTGYFSDDLIDSEFQSVDCLLNKTKEHYNELLVGIGSGQNTEEHHRPLIFSKIETKVKQEENTLCGGLSRLFSCSSSSTAPKPKPLKDDNVKLLGLGIEEAWLKDFKEKKLKDLKEKDLEVLRKSLKVMINSGFPILLYSTTFNPKDAKLGFRDRARQLLTRYIELKIRHFRLSKMEDNKQSFELQTEIQDIEKEMAEFDLKYKFECFNYTAEMDGNVESKVYAVLENATAQTQQANDSSALSDTNLSGTNAKSITEKMTTLIMGYYRPHSSFGEPDKSKLSLPRPSL